MAQPALPLQKIAFDLVDRYFLLAEQFFESTFKKPTFVFRKKGTVGGTAHLSKNLIQINQELALHYKLLFLEEIIPHELAHLIVYQQYGKVKPHGKEWQFVMATIFKKIPNRTHSFALPNSQIKKCFEYRCPCQIHALTQIRHRRIQTQKAIYICKKCSLPLVLIDKVGINSLI